MTGQVQRWRARPNRIEITTARYEAKQTGQAYRAMHAALLEVARRADPEAETTEALFKKAGTVLLVRYHPGGDDTPDVGCVAVESGSYLACWGPGVLDVETAGSVADWYEPLDGAGVFLRRLVAEAATAETWPGQACVLRDGRGTLRVSEDGATTITVRDADGKPLLILPVREDVSPGDSLHIDLAQAVP